MNPTQRPAARWPRGLGLTGLGLLLLLAHGCVHAPGRRASGRAVIRSQELTNAAGHRVSLEVLATEVTRFADVYATTVAQGVDDLLAKVDRPAARIEAVQWKLEQATAALVDATGVNPVLNVLDLVVLATVSRMVMEQEMSQVLGPEAQPLLARHRQLETNAWATANRVLEPRQQQELRAMIQQWRQKHPGQRYVAAARFRELAAVVGKTPQAAAGASPGSVLGWLYLDPFAGLDPAAVAIQETRQLAERALYYAQRMPMLLNWQAQLLSLQLAAQPEAKQVLDNAERLTRSAESFAQVATQLPQLVNDQREAALRQVLDGLAAERTNWMVNLTANAQTTRGLLTEARQTLNAASDAAVGIHATIEELQAFIRFVSPAKTNQASADTNRHPFNVLDYGTAATQVGLAANDLHGLLRTLNQSAPGLSRQLSAEATWLLQRAFLLGAALICLLLAGLVLAGLAAQALHRRWWLKTPAFSPEPPTQTLKPR